MKKVQKIITLLLAVGMVLTMVACGSKTGGSDTVTDPGKDTPAADMAPSKPAAVPGDNAAAEPVPEGQKDLDKCETEVLYLATSQDSGTLYPYAMTGQFGKTTFAFYEPMYDIMADGSYNWLLATGIDVVGDLESIVHIREGVKFSNGNPLTAQDVYFTMKLSAENPRFKMNVKAVDLEKTKVIDDYTIDLVYTRYDATQAIAFTQLYILDEESFDEVYLASHINGTGPYTLDEYVINSHLSCVRNENYWGTPATIKQITFKVINEPEQVVNALAVGDIDYANQIDITDVDYVKDLGYSVDVSWGGYTFVEYFSFDAASPLSSKEARMAVAYATDRESLAQIIYKGLSEPCTFPASQHTKDYDPRFSEASTLYQHGFDMDLAKDYAEQSGLVGKTVRITTNGNAGQTVIAQMIQSNLIKLGIDATIITYDNASYFNTIMDPANFDIAIFEPSGPAHMCGDILANYPDFVPLGWTGEVRDTYGKYSHGAMSTPDTAAAADSLLEAIKILNDVVPWFALVEYVTPSVFANDVGYSRLTLSGLFKYDELYFKLQ